MNDAKSVGRSALGSSQPGETGTHNALQKNGIFVCFFGIFSDFKCELQFKNDIRPSIRHRGCNSPAYQVT